MRTTTTTITCDICAREFSTIVDQFDTNCMIDIGTDTPGLTTHHTIYDDVCRDCLSEIKKTIRLCKEKHNPVLNTKVVDCDFSVRLLIALKQFDVHTVGDILKITHSDMLKARNFGKKSIDELTVFLSSRGLKLNDK